MVFIIESIIEELYTPLYEALSLIPFFAIEFQNGLVSMSLAVIISSLLVACFFFFVLFAPLWLVYRFFKGFRL
jgi:hypothetical protein